MEDLTRAYGEIALMHMREVRDGVLENRLFLGELQQVFAQVQAAYLNRLFKTLENVPLSKIKANPVSVLQHNGLTVCVLLSANSRLYGDILRKTYDKFIREVKATKAEATIMGKVGLVSFKEDMGMAPITYFDFPDDKLDRKQLGTIIEHLVQYETIRFFYPAFHNVFIQEPQMMEISARQPLGGSVPEVTKQQFHFEPSLEAVMAFFEQEIFGTYFEQMVREAQLSKFAARASSMDRASEKISHKHKELKLKRRIMVKRKINKKQLSLMAAYMG